MAATKIDDTDENDPLHQADGQLKAIITNLYVLIVQTHDYQGPNTQQAMTAEIKALIQNLLGLTQAARRLPTHLPIEIIQYVEGSRNPDIYTREFVELVMRYNQQQKGRTEAFANFRDILAQEMASGISEVKEFGIPDMKSEVKKVVEATGGHLKA